MSAELPRLPEFHELIPAGPGIDGRTEAKRDALRALYVGVWAVIGGAVEGDVAEFGTHTGLTALALAKSLADNTLPDRPAKRLLLLDSFEGLPEVTAEADAASPHIAQGHWHPGLCRGATADELRAIVETRLPAARVDIHPGWYADTVPVLPADTRLALLHVDCDLYQSTIDALLPCFERGFVAEGAQLYFDDWNCNRASPAFGQRRAWRELSERFAIDFSESGDYAAFGHKLIVHGYDGAAALG